MGVKLSGAQIADGYKDANGNTITGTPTLLGPTGIEFMGSNCHIYFGKNTRIKGTISFRRNHSTVGLGHNSWFRGQMSLGFGCEIIFGNDVYCGRDCYVTTAENTNITLGNDILISDSVYIRADDSHPIYDGFTGDRINPARPITIEDHVWLGQEVFVMPGAHIGTGSVIGARAMVTRSAPIPPHSLAVGSPATVQREGIHWVRKHLQNSLDIDERIPPIFSGV